MGFDVKASLNGIKTNSKSLFLIFCLLLGFSQALAASSEYVLRPGDVIFINVVEHDEFSLRTKIRPDGKINYPVIGDLEIAGMTSVAIVNMLEEKLQPYVNNVVVAVNIEQYFANKIFLIGELNRSGEFEIFEPVDVVRAIAMASGLKNPKAKEGLIIKASGEVVNVPLRKVLTTTGAKNNEAYILHPGDTFYVAKGFEIPWAAWSLIVSTITGTLTLYILLTQLGSK